MINVSLFKAKNDIRPKTKILPIADALAFFNQHQHKPLQREKDSAAFNLASYRKPGNRKEENIETLSGIVLNAEQPMTRDQLIELADRLTGLERASVIFTTYSSEPDKFKARVILFLEVPVTPSQYKKGKLAVRAAKLLGIVIDPACQGPTEVYYFPSMRDTDCEDSHLLYVTDVNPGITQEDLPDLEPGDEDEYVSQSPSVPKKGTTSRQGAVSGKDDDDEADVFKEINNFTMTYTGGVPPIYAERRYFLYLGPHWVEFSREELIAAIINDYHGRKERPEKAVVIVSAIERAYFKADFPERQPCGTQGPRHLIGVANGTLDPVAGVLVPDSPDHYLRVQFPFEWDDSRPNCPGWHRFLASVFRDDEDREAKIACLQEWFGLLLVPETCFQSMLVLYGNGANGKSVVTRIITRLLGEKNVSSVPLVRLSERFQTSNLAGKLANSTDEVSANTPLPDGLFKEIVSGGRIQGERKGKDHFGFVVTARLVASTNHLPRSQDTSDGYFRRFHILTFNRKFTKEEQDRNLVAELSKELGEIFKWAVAGLRRLLTLGAFTDVPSSTAAVEAYRESSNPVALFVKEAVLPAAVDNEGNMCKVATHEVYAFYKAFCSARGYPQANTVWFGREMSALGLKSIPSGAGAYHHLRLRPGYKIGIPNATKLLGSSTLDDDIRGK